MTASPEPQADANAALAKRIVFFDGVCGFCDSTVHWLIERDPAARLHFAPLQGPTASSVRQRFPGRFPNDLDTLVVLDRSTGVDRLLLRSAAVVAILDWLDAWPSRWLALVGHAMPRPIADLAYRLFASQRYRLFGELEACRIPSESERARFLD